MRRGLGECLLSLYFAVFQAVQDGNGIPGLLIAGRARPVLARSRLQYPIPQR